VVLEVLPLVRPEGCLWKESSDRWNDRCFEFYRCNYAAAALTFDRCEISVSR
jgi:hypothetical protein